MSTNADISKPKAILKFGDSISVKVTEYVRGGDRRCVIVPGAIIVLENDFPYSGARDSTRMFAIMTSDSFMVHRRSRRGTPHFDYTRAPPGRPLVNAVAFSMSVVRTIVATGRPGVFTSGWAITLENDVYMGTNTLYLDDVYDFGGVCRNAGDVTSRAHSHHAQMSEVSCRSKKGFNLHWSGASGMVGFHSYICPAVLTLAMCDALSITTPHKNYLCPTSYLPFHDGECSYCLSRLVVRAMMTSLQAVMWFIRLSRMTRSQKDQMQHAFTSVYLKATCAMRIECADETHCVCVDSPSNSEYGCDTPCNSSIMSASDSEDPPI